MRKYLLAVALLMVCAAFAQNPPRELVATSNLDSRVELAWKSPAPEITSYENAYDDGTGGGIDEAGRNDILSVRFTPTERCSLLAIKYFGYCPFPELNVEIGVYADNGSGRPNIYSPIYTTEHTIISGWQTVDLSEAGLTFDAGEEFHLGIKKIVSPDTFPHYIIHDPSPVPEQRSWWFDYSDFGFYPVPGDLQIRAIVTYGSRVVALSAEPVGKRTVPYDYPAPEEFVSPTSAEDVEYYNIYRGHLPDTSALEFLDVTNDTFYTDEDVTNDEVYYYAVKAYHTGRGLSGFSNLVCAVPRTHSSTATLDTLIYDDGSPDATAFYSEGNGFGTVLPINQVGQLKSLLYRFNTSGQFKPQIWSVDADEYPDSLLLSATSWLPVSTPGWREVNVEGWHTLIVDRPVLAGCIVGDFTTGLAVDVPGRIQSYDYGGGSWSPLPDSTYMIRAVIEYYDDCAYFHIRQGWNLVGVPVYFEDNSVAHIFPTAFGGVAYRWKFSTETESWAYDTTHTINAGEGYWIYSSVDTSYMLCGGIPIRTMDIALHPGWNLISGISRTDGIANYEIETYPNGILGSHIYLYTYDPVAREMVEATRILPGRGYFILSMDSGALIMR